MCLGSVFKFQPFIKRPAKGGGNYESKLPDKPKFEFSTQMSILLGNRIHPLCAFFIKCASSYFLFNIIGFGKP